MATLTVYCDPGTGSTTCDARIVQDDGSGTNSWATLRGGAGTSAAASSSESFAAQIARGTTGTNWSVMSRGGFTFDTSTLDDAATISATVFSLFGTGKDTGITQSYGVVSFAPAADNNIVASDFVNLGTTRYADTDITGAGYSTSAYNDWTFNATGIAAVSKTGITKIGVRTSGDIDNTEPGAGSAFIEARIACYFADQTGTTNDPKLVITYSVGGATHKLLTLGVG